MKNFSCIACGEPAAMKTQRKEVVAAFCRQHFPFDKMRMPIIIRC